MLAQSASPGPQRKMDSPTVAIAVPMWEMPTQLVIASGLVITIQTLLSLSANVLLFVTICNTSSLKTPPNSLLLDICVNNLFLVLCMVCSLVTFAESSDLTESWLLVTVTDLQGFLLIMCFLHYCCMFAAIGYYRNQTVRKPVLTLRQRSRIIHRSIVAGWAMSVSLALALSLSFKRSLSTINWNPFRRCVDMNIASKFLSTPNNGQCVILGLCFIAVAGCFCIIVSSYKYILKTLIKAQPHGKNRINPWMNPPSIIIDEARGTTQSRQAYFNGDSETEWKGPFTISDNVQHFMVHYRRPSLSTVVQSLENPSQSFRRVSSTRDQDQDGTLQIQPDDKSEQDSVAAFTDISPGAELQRLQHVKNNCALRNQSWKRDHVSLTSATKNCLAMIITFTLTSLPLFICIVPGVLHQESVASASQILIYCRLLFFINSPVYPIWYFVFCKQVRKSFCILVDRILIRLRLRQ